nr:hypothetical protein [Tanacetum cinerariifolium]
MPCVDWSDKVDQEMRCMDWREIRVGLNSAFNLNGERDKIFRYVVVGCGARAPCHCVWIMNLAGLQGSCSLRPCASYTSRGVVTACPLWILSGVGLEPIIYCAAQACGPVDTIRHHVPQSSVSSMRSSGRRSLFLAIGTSVVKDPLLVDEAVDLPCVELLNKNQMGLLDFVKSVDPFKVKVVKRTLAENEAAVGSGSGAAATEDATSSSVTPTLERALEDAPHDNVVPLVSSSQVGASVPMSESTGDSCPSSAPELETGVLSATPSQGSSASEFYESQTIDSATALNVYVPNWSVTNNAHVDNPATCRSLLDHVTPPGYWAMLHNQHDARFLDNFNINSAQHVFLVSELCLRYEHEIMTREKYEKRLSNSVAMVQQGDAKVAGLKAKLEKSESEATEVEELHKRVSNLEAMVAVKVGEAASLTAQNVGLLEKVSALELERDGLKGQVVISMAINKGIQEGLEAVVIHGRTGRSLTQIEAYDLEVKRKYVFVVSDFEGLSFPLLDEQESLKDSLFMRGLCPPSSSALSGTSSSVPPYDDSVGVADYKVSTFVLTDDGGPTNPPLVVQSHDDLFDTSILNKSGDGCLHEGELKITLFQVLDVPCAREYVSASVPELTKSPRRKLVLRTLALYYFSILDLFLASRTTAFSLLSSRMSRFRSSSLSFSAWFTSTHLIEVIPISSGITALVP